MSRVEEMVVVKVAPPQAMRVLASPARFADWVAPDASVAFRTAASTLSPGDRFRLDLVGGISFDYTVEAATERDLVLAFEGPWSGEERWSFVPDGAETIVRRVYEVRGGGTLALLAWQTVGRPLVSAHFRLELGRFRDVVERAAGPRAELETGEAPVREVPREVPSPEVHEAPSHESREATGARATGEETRRRYTVDEG